MEFIQTVGFTSANSFKKAMAAAKQGNMNQFADEILDSNWAKKNPQRANEIANKARCLSKKSKIQPNYNNNKENNKMDINIYRQNGNNCPHAAKNIQIKPKDVNSSKNCVCWLCAYGCAVLSILYGLKETITLKKIQNLINKNADIMWKGMYNKNLTNLSANDQGKVLKDYIKDENIVVAELPGLNNPNLQHFVLVESIRTNAQGEYEVILFDSGRQARCSTFINLGSLKMRSIHYGNKIELEKIVNC